MTPPLPSPPATWIVRTPGPNQPRRRAMSECLDCGREAIKVDEAGDPWCAVCLVPRLEAENGELRDALREAIGIFPVEKDEWGGDPDWLAALKRRCREAVGDAP